MNESAEIDKVTRTLDAQLTILEKMAELEGTTSGKVREEGHQARLDRQTLTGSDVERAGTSVGTWAYTSPAGGKETPANTRRKLLAFQGMSERYLKLTDNKETPRWKVNFDQILAEEKCKR